MNANPTKEDYNEYAALLYQTNVMHENADPNNRTPRSSKSWKWKTILGPIWNEYKKFDSSESEGSGLIIPG